MVYILILQNPLRIQPYSSLTALFDDNGKEVLQASRSNGLYCSLISAIFYVLQ